jgi:hypothetical protein
MHSLFQVFQLKSCVHFSFPHACYIPPAHIILLDLNTLIVFDEDIHTVQLFIMKFSSVPSYFLSLR